MGNTNFRANFHGKMSVQFRAMWSHAGSLKLAINSFCMLNI